MFRQKPLPVVGASLHPFVLEIRDGVLLGLAPDAKEGAPCVNCVENWLHDRDVHAKRGSLAELSPQAKEVMRAIITENVPHVFHEVLQNGQTNRLECLVFPHARCNCNKTSYIPPAKMTKQTNFAFSPVFQLKCVRYGTPSGNLWFYTAMGQSPLTLKLVAAHGADYNKDKARLKTVDKWLKKASLLELGVRIETGETFTALDPNTGESQIIASHEELQSSVEIMGTGNTRREAMLEAFQTLAKQKTLREYSARGKNPMLVVGANSWLRNRVPFFLIQQYDLYPLFYPNQSPTWVTGLAAFSRLDTHEAPIFVFGADANISKAFDKAIFEIMEHCRPTDWRSRQSKRPSQKKSTKGSKLNLWWTHWIYRCPKNSLKDTLQLEAYSQNLDAWNAYFAGKQESLSIVEVNGPQFPKKLKRIIKLQPSRSLESALTKPSNVKGIGSWATIGNGLTSV